MSTALCLRKRLQNYIRPCPFMVQLHKILRIILEFYSDVAQKKAQIFTEDLPGLCPFFVFDG